MVTVNKVKLSRGGVAETIQMRTAIIMKEISRKKPSRRKVWLPREMSLFSFLSALGMGEMGTQSSSSSNLQVIIRPGGAVNCWNIPSIITLTSSGEAECKLLLHLIRRFN